MPKSTFYFETTKKDVVAERNAVLAEEIQEIFTETNEDMVFVVFTGNF